MTREEIIEHLDSIVGTYEILLGHGVNSDILDVDDIEAIKEVISALSNKGDLISKQAVLNTLDNADKFLDEERTVEKYKELLTECIKVLPSADVRPNIHATWGEDGHGHIFCTACKETNVSEWKSRFCPLCGAIMDGEPKGLTAKVVIVGKPSLLTHIPIGEKGGHNGR